MSIYPLSSSRSFFFKPTSPLPHNTFPTSVSLMLGSVVFDIVCYLVYQVAYNIRNFVYIRFVNATIIFIFIVSYLLLSVLLSVKLGESLYFLDYITLDYFHKIKTGFPLNEQVSWHRRDQLQGTTCSFSPSRCGVQTVFRCHPHCLQSSARRWTVLVVSSCPSSETVCFGDWGI